jgi:hypothetical protein
MEMPRHRGTPKTGGRRKGSVNKTTAAMREMTDRALAAGITPMELMLDNMRYFYGQALAADNEVGCIEMRTLAQACAKDVSPYVHPKLATIEYKDEDKRRVVIEWKLPKEMLDRIGDTHRGRPTSPEIPAAKRAAETSNDKQQPEPSPPARHRSA